MRRILVFAGVIAAMLAVAAPVWADGFSQGNGSKAAANWKLYSRNASGRALYSKVAAASATGDGIGFAFPQIDPTLPQGATFFATKHPGDLLGDLTGKTLSATISISGTNPVFTYNPYYPGCDRGPAYVRLFFEGNTTGPFDPADYWWSNPLHASLDSLVGNTVTLTVPLDGSKWSNYYGHFGTGDYAASFAASVAKVTFMGLSFGGGCFFSNGAGLASGSATFNLSSFNATS